MENQACLVPLHVERSCVKCETDRAPFQTRASRERRVLPTINLLSTGPYSTSIIRRIPPNAQPASLATVCENPDTGTRHSSGLPHSPPDATSYEPADTIGRDVFRREELQTFVANQQRLRSKTSHYHSSERPLFCDLNDIEKDSSLFLSLFLLWGRTVSPEAGPLNRKQLIQAGQF